MNHPSSPFLAIPAGDWFCANESAFAIFDRFPVSPGHVLVITRRVVPTWFDASPVEQSDLMALVNEVRRLLDLRLDPRPDGYNVGFNCGAASGQTVPHVHIHVIPRYQGDMPDPRGGVRHVIPEKGNYLVPRSDSLPSAPPSANLSAPPSANPSATAAGFPNASGASAVQEVATAFSLSTGHPALPLWKTIGQRVAAASEVDLLASFIQPSGLDLVQQSVFSALRAEARIRILVGDYLYITSADALRRLLGWMALAADLEGSGSLEVRLAEISRLDSAPDSFHPKAWRIADAAGGLVVVGSSNLSRPALESGVEWNLIGQTSGDTDLDQQLARAFAALWAQSTPLDRAVVERYAGLAHEARLKFTPPESVDVAAFIPEPRPWQREALASLAQVRAGGYQRALVAVATGLGKTWLAAFDVLAFGSALSHPSRVLVIAHRAEILIQAEATLRSAMLSRWPKSRVSWFLAGDSDMSGDLVVASVQKLARPDGLAELDRQRFDYVVIDEVHHAQAPTYRRVMARLRATFTLGLTATPERADGVDVASLFDDVLAWQATVGDGIAEGSLVPFHYLGLKDDVDFAQIPWRNGRFDLAVLEEKLENSGRMERLWSAWCEDPAARTLVFCCSRRHALYSRDWLRRRGVRAAAVFSGVGGDSRADSLAAFGSGALDALCVVDLFNEGLDIPGVERVVMLRPTESRVVFLQQLGRGLRAAENKLRLRVIDFVGNHRVFASRLIHLMSLGDKVANWANLANFLRGEPPELPEGCLLELELEARDVMAGLLPGKSGAVAEAYRGLRDELGRRPSPAELFWRGYLPGTLYAKFDSWFDFVGREGDLATDEAAVLAGFSGWLRMLESTSLNKSYKMVVLRVLLDRDAFWSGMEAEPLAAACREFLLSHPALRHDLPPTREFPDPAAAPIALWARWWCQWPLARWTAEQAGRQWFVSDAGRFFPAFSCSENLRPAFEAMTAELVDYRLAHYSHSRLSQDAVPDAGRFVARVSHSSGKPILRLPSVEELPGRPFGPTLVTLPDGSQWVFKFVKIACNVASPEGSEENLVAELLRGWFGPDAGVPGTRFEVAFTKSETGWSVEPLALAGGVAATDSGMESRSAAQPQPGSQSGNQPGNQVAAPLAAPPAAAPVRSAVLAAAESGRVGDLSSADSGGHPDGDADSATVPAPDVLPGFVTRPAARDKFTRLVPVYSLAAAAGFWGPENSPEEVGWAEVPDTAIQPGMFIARVRGHSMEPKIRDGSWNLFRPCPAGSRNGRILLVQLHSPGDPDEGGRFTVKKYLSRKSSPPQTRQPDPAAAVVSDDSSSPGFPDDSASPVSRDGFDASLSIADFDSASPWHHASISLLPLNPAYPPIEITPTQALDLQVIGEWLACLK